MFNIGNCTDCTTCGSCQQTPDVDTPTLFCMNCQPSEAPCIKICENNAFRVLGGAVTLDFARCSRCMDCVDACPIGIITIPH